MKKRVAIYLRVSTKEQTTYNQFMELDSIAKKSGWEIVDLYEDEALSGGKGRDERPAFDKLCKDATRRKFDLIMAWSVDRLGRSLKDLVDFLEEMRALKLDLYIHQQGVDTTTPAGRAMFGMLSVFADFERAMIQERVNAGLARAKAQGKTLGRPSVPKDVQRRIVKARDNGLSLRKIASREDVSLGVVHKILKAQAA